MADYMKQVPQELRNPSAVAAANVHRDLSGAGPSGTPPNLRTEGNKTASHGDGEFAAFAQGGALEGPQAADSILSAKSESRAAQIAAASFTPDDLKPRSRDGADVVEILAGSVSLDDLDDALSFLAQRQEERWKHEAQLPAETAAPAPFTSESHPYLFDLLHLPDEEAITSYLTRNTYSNDVWGLPGSLKQDLDLIKDLDNGSSSRQNALRRLTMLKRHLELDKPQKDLTPKDGKAREQQDSRQPTDGFDYTDWVRIYQS